MAKTDESVITDCPAKVIWKLMTDFSNPPGGSRAF
jgi:hypothetical protein